MRYGLSMICGAVICLLIPKLIKKKKEKLSYKRGLDEAFEKARNS